MKPHPCDMHETWYCMRRRFEHQLNQIWDEIKADLIRAAIIATLGCWFIAGVLFSWNQIADASVQADAYPVTGKWQSYPDYLDRKLYVEGFEDPVCSAGVIWLGANYYQVPQGVSEFKCMERGVE